MAKNKENIMVESPIMKEKANEEIVIASGELDMVTITEALNLPTVVEIKLTEATVGKFNLSKIKDCKIIIK